MTVHRPVHPAWESEKILTDMEREKWAQRARLLPGGLDFLNADADGDDTDNTQHG